jgi:hypothetical protein
MAPSGVTLDAELTRQRNSGKSIPVKILGYAAIADLFKHLPLSKANPQAADVPQKLQLASWMSLFHTGSHL